MGIMTETQVAITCDTCSDNWVNSHVTQKEAIEQARKDGWKIGGKVTCPKCFYAKKNDILL